MHIVHISCTGAAFAVFQLSRKVKHLKNFCTKRTSFRQRGRSKRVGCLWKISGVTWQPPDPEDSPLVLPPHTCEHCVAGGTLQVLNRGPDACLGMEARREWPSYVGFDTLIR